ncbi:hypothetical protein EJ08DRAFT_657468 [Tothia fuscella]|uniref:Uncharacterized protein n=1 Tax=Tothia fuscella TaxID=1048955 RepID=A0A9P4U130_9PEZI|nr:hypothetical protein EJ08DRAFT_657468 [Tothia fuscella]
MACLKHRLVKTPSEKPTPKKMDDREPQRRRTGPNPSARIDAHTQRTEHAITGIPQESFTDSDDFYANIEIEGLEASYTDLCNPPVRPGRLPLIDYTTEVAADFAMRSKNNATAKLPNGLPQHEATISRYLCKLCDSKPPFSPLIKIPRNGALVCPGCGGAGINLMGVGNESNQKHFAKGLLRSWFDICGQQEIIYAGDRFKCKGCCGKLDREEKSESWWRSKFANEGDTRAQEQEWLDAKKENDEDEKEEEEEDNGNRVFTGPLTYLCLDCDREPPFSQRIVLKTVIRRLSRVIRRSRCSHCKKRLDWKEKTTEEMWFMLLRGNWKGRLKEWNEAVEAAKVAEYDDQGDDVGDDDGVAGDDDVDMDV